MTVRTKSAIKNLFINGSVPDEDAFKDLIDTALAPNFFGFNQSGVLINTSAGLTSIDSSIARYFLEVNTTASVVDVLVTQDGGVFVSSDVVITGTAGVTTSGDLVSGYSVSLDGSATPKWVRAGNRVTVDSKGRLIDSSIVTSDFGFSYYSSVAAADNILITHPQFASARAVSVLVSAFKIDAPSRVTWVFVDKEGVELPTSALSVWQRPAVTGVEVEGGLRMIGDQTAAVVASVDYSASFMFYPMPHAKNVLCNSFICRGNNATRSTGTATLTREADATIAGLKIKCDSSAEFTSDSGSIRIGII